MPTVIRVSASYGAKKPVDPSNTFAGSEEAHVSYALEEDVVGLTKEQIAKRMGDLAKELDSGVKLAVAASLDIGFIGGDGTNPIRLTPVTVPNIPHTSKPTGNYAGRPQRGGQAGGQYGAPKADLTQQPVLMLAYNGEGKPPLAFYDCRSLKADGTYNERAADLRSVDAFTGPDGKKSHIPIWLFDKNGAPKPVEQALVRAAEQVAAQRAPY